MQQYLEYSDEVAKAIQHKKPILALESTLITHGLPYPHNLYIAKTVEDIAREKNVVPATIAIIKGKIKIGLEGEEITLLAQDKRTIKASRRDIPYALSQKLTAGTTVAATLFCAHLAGIKVFATGGIGGVHRGMDLDISADLIELARTPLAVICAGVKAILDLPKTLEFLETYSIPIVGYRSSRLPAFYTSETSHLLPARVDDIETLVELLNIHWQCGMTSSVIITNPIPEQDEISLAEIEPIIQCAIKKATLNQIQGKAITPFLLQEVATATSGRSLKANLSLIKNNVRLGAELAYALAPIRKLVAAS